MKNLSNKIDTYLIDVFERVYKATKSINIDFFVIGATAKWILIKYFYEKKLVLRTTQDIDLGILIDSWNKFEKLKKLLIDDFGFQETKIEHRIIFNGNLVDIVPFGSIVDSNNKITWPRTDKIFSVIGFEEVYNYSFPIKIKETPEIIINFASISGLAILKLIAWYDSFPDRKKDAEDLLIIIQNYADFDNVERLYDKEITIFENGDIDYWNASAQLLGRDIRKMLNPKTLELITNILDQRNDKRDYLIQHMLGTQYDDHKSEEVKKLLLYLNLGITETII